jgi:hypothetical protein
VASSHVLAASHLGGIANALPGAFTLCGPLFFNGSMRKTLSNTAYALGVRKHPGDLWCIRFRNQHNFAKLRLGFVCLRGEDVAHLGLAALKLAGTSDLEALGRAAVCLQLWHGVPNVETAILYSNQCIRNHLQGLQGGLAGWDAGRNVAISERGAPGHSGRGCRPQK